MDRKQLIKFVGRKHVDEIQVLLGEDGRIPDDVRLKNPYVTLFLSIFLGLAGIDRLYQSGSRVFLCKIALIIFTLGTWWFPDIGYSIPMTQEINYRKIVAAL